MTYTKLWYCSAYKNLSGEWKEIPPEMEELRIIPREIQDGRILCPIHCHWEDFEATGEFDITCSRGQKIHGLLVPYLSAENVKYWWDTNGILFLDDIRKNRRLWRSKNYNEENFSRFMVSLTVDTSECSAIMRERIIDSDKVSAIKLGSLALTKVPEKHEASYVFFRGKYATHSDSCHCVPFTKKMIFEKNIDDLYMIGKPYSFAPCVSEEMELAAEKLLESYTGRKIRINKNYYRGFNLLLALAHYPYEANIFSFILYLDLLEENPLISLDRDNPDIYNELCNKLDIKSFPALRKLFEKKPHILIWYKYLTDMGFRDINVIMDILKTCYQTDIQRKEYDDSDEDEYVLSQSEIDYLRFGEDYDIDFSRDGTSFLNNITDYIPFRTKDDYFIFFCRYSIPKRGERATWNALNREPDLNYRDREDTARLFEKYFNDLKDEEKEQVLKEGFTQRTHDMLSKIAHNMEHPNIVFSYSSVQKNLEDKIDGFKFHLPVDSSAMHSLGSVMHNCVFSYVDNVVKGESTIVYATFGYKYVMCIEVGENGNIVQARGNYNESLKGQAKIVFEKWCEKHKLDFDSVYDY